MIRLEPFKIEFRRGRKRDKCNLNFNAALSRSKTDAALDHKERGVG